ncbi:MAG TPA: AgmX/PglI C-terminal domain-containing protein [Myxococcaceae bacterium]|nr:AgmX/PglI C-terminal domain-containing protein [Myxococcaceae bacterium]
MASTASPKILRVALVQGHKITEERHFRRRGDVTVGQDAKNTFVVPVSSLPSTFPVFEHKNNQYFLQFDEDMDGRVRLGTADVDFAALRDQGLAKKRGNYYVLPLSETARGTVRFGEVTLLFQFSSPPPEPSRAVMPEEIRGAFWRSMDRVFMGVLAGSLFLHFTGAFLIARAELPPEPELTLDQLDDRFAKVLIPVKKEPEKVVEADGGADKKEEVKKETKKEESKAAANDAGGGDAAAKKAAIQQKVASKGLLKILGSSGGGAGAFEDVLGSGTGTADIASALSGAGGVGVATADAVAGGGPRGGGSGNVAGIGDLGTSGGGNVNLGGKTDVKVSGTVKDATPDVESADVDRDALARYVRARLKAITSCYEKELKRNPSLKGKVVVRFSITTSGRAGDIDIEENTVGSEAVGACIKTVIRGWVFPFKPEDDVPVAYPFVFSPAS